MLEHRNGNTYAYRSVRRNGKPRREYLGAGESGRILSQLYDLKTLRRNYHASLVRAHEATQASALDRMNQRATDAIDAVNRLVGAALERAGYHRTHRHSWRRKRGSTLGNISEEFEGMSIERAEAVGKLDAWLEDREARADAGDVDAARELYGDLGDDEPPPPPEPTRKKRHARNLPEAARLNLLLVATGENDDETKDKILAEVRAVETDLAGENPSPIVRLLASAAAAAYFDHWITDSHGKLNLTSPNDATERYRTRAHRRYLATLRELATVRRLESKSPTTLKIVGHAAQQVNIGQTSGKAIASD